jgi:hypothetical protein
MNRSFFAPIALVVIPAMLATGCGGGPKAPYEPRHDQLSKGQYPKVTIEEPLSTWVIQSDAVVGQAPNGGPLTVSVPIRLGSQTPDQYARIQYRFIFLDSTGAPLRTQSDWRYMRLEPRNQVFLQGNATDTTATDWRCEIRSGR